MLITILLGFLFFAVFAMLWLESFWSNVITIMNVLLASFLAMSFFEPLATLVDNMLPSFTYLWDYLILWLLFAIFFSILRLCTDLASRNRVKFRVFIELPGRILSAAVVAWIVVCFTVTSFHIAPLPAAPFSGGFGQYPDGRSFLFFRPDHYYLNLFQFVTRGSLSAFPATGADESLYPVDKGRNTFDPNADFILKYRQRRRDLEKVEGLRVRRDES